MAGIWGMRQNRTEQTLNIISAQAKQKTGTIRYPNMETPLILLGLLGTAAK